MRYIIFTLFTAFFIFTFYSFGLNNQPPQNRLITEVRVSGANKADPVVVSQAVDRSKTTEPNAQHFIEYAKTLIGTPYVYGSVDPAVGFDCSGFVNHVSNHFGMDVPRSSVQFTDFGNEVEQSNAKPGDLILFTGTNPNERIVGHIGIITENPADGLRFIHSSSGNSKGVTISDLSEYYKTRFVKIIRILPSADNKLMS